MGDCKISTSRRSLDRGCRTTERMAYKFKVIERMLPNPKPQRPPRCHQLAADGDDLLDDVFLSIESLRNAGGGVQDHIRPWVNEYFRVRGSEQAAGGAPPRGRKRQRDDEGWSAQEVSDEEERQL